MNNLLYRPDIDVLRALAVSAVLCFHAFSTVFPRGFLGVDVFFIISGYLITHIIINRMSDDHQIITTMFNFWKARIRRLFPSFLFMLFLVYVAGYIFFYPSEFKVLNDHGLKSLLYWQNFTLISEIDYFDEESIRKPFLHLWSLSVEEHFYFIWPLILITIFKLSNNHLKLSKILILLIIISSFTLSNYFYHQNTQMQFYHSLARFWELSIGAFISFLAVPKPTKRTSSSVGLAITLLLIILFLPFNFEYMPVIQLACCLLTAYIIYYGFSRADNFKPALYLGKISYPLYLLHWPIFSFAGILSPTLYKEPFSISIMILLSFLLAMFSFHVVERLRFAKKGLSIILPLYFLALLFSIAGQFGVFSKALPNQLKQENIIQLKRTPATDNACIQYVGDIKFDYCRSNLVNKQKVIALIGDSHAHVLFPGLSHYAEKQGYGTVLFANSSCPPLPGFKWYDKNTSVKQCQKKIQQIIDTINDKPEIQKIVLVTRGPVYIHGEVDGKFTQESVLHSLENFVDREHLNYKSYGLGIQRFWGQLNHIKAKDRFYMLENPELDFSPKDALPRFLFKSNEWQINRNLYDLRMLSYNNVVTKAGEKNFQILDPRDAICFLTACQFYDKKFLYADDDHFSIWGSYKVMEHFNRQIFEVTNP